MNFQQKKGTTQSTDFVLRYPKAEALHVSNLMKRIIKYKLPLSKWCTKFTNKFCIQNSFYVFKKHERYNYAILLLSDTEESYLHSQDYEEYKQYLFKKTFVNHFLYSKIICDYQEISTKSSLHDQHGILMKVPHSIHYLTLREYLLQTDLVISELISIIILILYYITIHNITLPLSISNLIVYEPLNLQSNEWNHFLQLNFKDYGLIYTQLSKCIFMIPSINNLPTQPKHSYDSSESSILDEIITILRKHKNYTGKKDKITLIAYLISWWNQNNQDVQQIKQQPIYFLLKLHELGLFSCKLPSQSTVNIYNLGNQGISFQKTITTEQTIPGLAYQLF